MEIIFEILLELIASKKAYKGWRIILTILIYLIFFGIIALLIYWGINDYKKDPEPSIAALIIASALIGILIYIFIYARKK